MTKNLIVFGLVILTGACRTTPPATLMPHVDSQTDYHKATAQIFLKGAVSPVIPRGMEALSLSSTASFQLSQGQRVDVILDSGEIESVLVISSGPYPALGVLVSPEDAKKIKKAKSMELRYAEERQLISVEHRQN